MDSLIEFWHGLPGLVRWILNFWFSVIFVRGILANEITEEMKKRGILKDGVINGIKRFITNLLNERHQAILAHHKHYRTGQGHDSKSAFTCSDCTVFA